MRRGMLALIAALCLTLFAAGALGENAPDTKEETVQEIPELYGYIGKRMNVYRWGDEKSHVLGTVEAGTVVDVYVKGRTWTRIGFEDKQGYVLTKFVERVQRKDPSGVLRGYSSVKLLFPLL